MTSGSTVVWCVLVSRMGGVEVRGLISVQVDIVQKPGFVTMSLQNRPIYTMVEHNGITITITITITY